MVDAPKETSAAIVTDPTASWGFVPRNRSTNELKDLWRRVLFNAENAPACPCHGIISGRLDPDAIETNMLAPLRTQYREQGARDLTDYLERRMRKSPFAGLRQSFDTWLGNIGEAPLTPDLRTQLIDDLRGALAYHAQADFVCAEPT
jgi:hypothetical protein